MKGFFVVAALLLASTFAAAQKADAAFVVGGSFVSDTNGTIIIPPPLGGGTANVTVKSDHHLFFEGALGVRVLDAKAVSLHIEVPIAATPSTKLTEPITSTTLDHITTLFITPALRVKFLPGAPVSPWVSGGGGWARYSLKDASLTQNKAALQYGGGLDFKTGLPVLGFRAEVRDFVTGDPDFNLGSLFSTKSGLHHHNILVGGGIVFRF
jgi:hypothetical protein